MVIAHATSGAVRHRAEVERAVASMLSLVDTARRSPARNGVRFDRGPVSLLFERGCVTTWRDTTAGRPLSVDVQGVPFGAGDERLAAMAAVRDLSAVVASAYAASAPAADAVVSRGAPLRRLYVALRAAAALAGLHHADLHLQHPCRRTGVQANVYCDGPSPRTLHPAILAELGRDVPEACVLDAIASGGVVRASVHACTWTEEVDDDPISVLRLLDECGLAADDLRLVPAS